MPVQDDDDDPWNPAVSISHDGKIEGIYVPQDQRRPAESWERKPLPTPADQPLELAPQEPKPPPPSEPEPERARERWVPISVIAVTLLACAAVAAILIHHRGNPILTGAPASATDSAPGTAQSLAPMAAPAAGNFDDSNGAPALTVQSEPSGAEVFVGDEDLGRTPLLGSNGYATNAKVTLRVELPGYQPWTGTFTGGVRADVRAKLRRK